MFELRTFIQIVRLIGDLAITSVAARLLMRRDRCAAATAVAPVDEGHSTPDNRDSPVCIQKVSVRVRSMMRQTASLTRMHLLLLSATLSASVLQAAERPNILFLLSDDHSYPYLGCYGSKDVLTPNLAGNKEYVQIEREFKQALTEKMVLDWDFLPTPLR
jgi:hypothetical protein